MITNQASGTAVTEIAPGIFQISTPVPVPGIPGGFSFNQFLVVDDESLLFHTGPRGLSPLVVEAVAAVIPLERLNYVALSHHENDEDGGMDALLERAPRAVPVCGRLNAMLNGELYARSPRGLGDGETLPLGRRIVRWFDAPHLPHGAECGYLFELYTSTLLCGDLFAQPGAALPAVSESEDAVFGPSEALRVAMDLYSGARGSRARLQRLAGTEPRLLACMHGSSFRGDGSKLLRELADRLGGEG
jgi:glyoxylase-like metal-dependent hydrolase (beta-lactamase superfamily II)